MIKKNLDLNIDNKQFKFLFINCTFGLKTASCVAFRLPKIVEK